MATILTVHGTFASGRAKGEAWWQEGSAFETHLRELVAADGGEISWQPVIWDGLNSEASRRAAGARLVEQMLALEERAEPYCVIGHSHGGSVISAALLECANRQNRLAHLRTWLTIGTPFIHTVKHRLLFSRLGGMGRSVYVGLLVGGLLGLIGANLEFIGEALEVAGFGIGVGGMIIEVGLISIALVLLPLILLYLLMLYMQRNLLPAYKPRTVDFAAQSFQARWVSLRHANDEAVAGLRSLRTLDFDIFSSRFAVPAVAVFALLLMLLAVVIPLFSPTAMKALFELVKDSYLRNTWAAQLLAPGGKLIGDGQDVLVNALLVCATAMRILDTVVDPIFNGISPYLGAGRGTVGMFIGMFVRFLLIFIFSALIAVALMWIVHLLAVALSQLLSRVLNPVAREQIRATGFGSDARGDKAVDTQDFPIWLKQGQPPLPDVLGEEIEAKSDAAAAAAISHLRGALRDIAYSKGPGAAADLLSKYLTWDELIHTSYFKAARLRKLVAYAVAQAQGFHATAAFKQDPDYALVAAWYEDIVAARSRTYHAEPADHRPGYVPQLRVEG